jgi:hypothetical protein
MSARRWVEYLIPDAISMQMEWVRDLTRGDTNLLKQIAQSPTARRLLTRTAHKRFEVPVPTRATLAPNQQWLLLDHRRQHALARRLALEALHDFVRTTVDAASVTVLRKELGEDGYRAAMAGPGLPVEGLERPAFSTAVKRGRFADYVIGVGAALLETTTRSGDAFAALRMRFAFSPACWASRPRDLQVNETDLATKITEAASS